MLLCVCIGGLWLISALLSGYWFLTHFSLLIHIFLTVKHRFGLSSQTQKGTHVHHVTTFAVFLSLWRIPHILFSYQSHTHFSRNQFLTWRSLVYLFTNIYSRAFCIAFIWILFPIGPTDWCYVSRTFTTWTFVVTWYFYVSKKSERKITKR